MELTPLQLEIKNAIEFFTDKELLVKYISVLIEQQYLQGKFDLLREYNISLKKDENKQRD